jgi:uncharacterized Tic20 family protein
VSTYEPNDILSDGDQRTFSVVIHVLSLFFPLLAPLLGFLIFRNRGELVTQHMRQALNYQLSLICCYVITGITVVGIIMWPILAIIAIVQIIKAAVAAGDGQKAAFWPLYAFIKA